MTNMVHITPPPLSPQSMADLLCTIVILCHGKDMYNREFWAYMCIKPSMAEAFKNARDSGSFCMGEYGTIIEAGEGKEPPRDVQACMARDYGARPNFEEQLLSVINTIKKSQPA